MPQYQSQSISRQQLMVMSVNLLHRAFMEAPRTVSKSLYRDIFEGNTVSLTEVQMDDGTLLRFDLALDHSEYHGSLNYSAFRASLSSVLGSLAAALQSEQEVAIFSANDDPDQMIFGKTGVTLDQEVPAVMVLSARVRASEAAVLLRPMYIDHRQFLQAREAADG